jgi:hypothetical protein
VAGPGGAGEELDGCSTGFSDIASSAIVYWILFIVRIFFNEDAGVRMAGFSLKTLRFWIRL